MSKLESGPMPFVMGNDGQEAIVVLGQDFQLVQKGRIDELGSTKLAARAKLKELGKESNFTQFMAD